MEKILQQKQSLTTCQISIENLINDLQSLEVKVNWKRRAPREEHRTGYTNLFMCFDIETTSTYIKDPNYKPHRGRKKEHEDEMKAAFMWVWQVAIGPYVYIGRTWNEYLEFTKAVEEVFELGRNEDGDTVRMMVFVHNLAYEFQFIRNLFRWENVFSLSERKPVKAITEGGAYEYRCTYVMSAKSLEDIADDLHSHNLQKMVGDLDYELIRNCKTPITPEELGYIVNDVLIIQAYIEEELEEVKYLYNLYLTNTGRVRKFTKKKTLYKDKKPNYSYSRAINNLTLGTYEYELLKQAFQGGFTHANPLWVGETVHNVVSKDFTSSYPAVLACEQFPMSKGTPDTITSKEQLKKHLKTHCCLFNVMIKGLRKKLNVPDGYISESKCHKGTLICENTDIFNGRVYRAESLCLTVTEVDWDIITKCYDMDKYLIGDFFWYSKGYLPKEFISALLELYQQKTQYKDVVEKEIEYQRVKGMLNSFYGMCVTDIMRDTIVYEDEDWGTESADRLNVLQRYNNIDPKTGKQRSYSSRFLSYPWGVWCTAYARRNLWTGIFELGNDWLYADTDSVKYINHEKHNDYFNIYNNNNHEKMQRAMKRCGLAIDYYSPKTVENVSKPLGAWDADGEYDRFKTLGAKRYMVEKDGEHKLTVAGTGKKSTMRYIEKLAAKTDKDVFELFENDLYIPKGETGKSVHTYIDYETRGTITDYLGNVGEYHEYSSVHLEAADYSLGISETMLMIIKGIKIGG